MRYMRLRAKKPRVVIRYYYTFYGERMSGWSLVGNPNDLRDSIIGVPFFDKKEAMEYIESHGLVLCLKNKYGEVYDTPERDYKNFWKMRNSMDVARMMRIEKGKQIEKEYKSGKGFVQIALEMGLSIGTVAVYLKEYYKTK